MRSTFIWEMPIMETQSDEMLAMVGGLIVLVGGILLLYKGKLAADAAKEPVLAWESRWFGNIRTTSVALGFFLLGAFLLLFPLWLVQNRRQQENAEIVRLKAQIENPESVTIGGPVDSQEFPVVVYASIIQNDLQRPNEAFRLIVPLYQRHLDNYRIIYIGPGISTSQRVLPGELQAGKNVTLPKVDLIKNPNTKGLPKANKTPDDLKAYNDLTSAPDEPVSAIYRDK
jgi:hypothetical protein